MDYVVKRVKDNIYVLSLRDTEVNYFEATREIGHEGILYNAYVIDTPDGAILIDGRKKGYEKAFENALTEVIGDKPIKAYVVNHSEPDHTGTFPLVIKKYDPVVYAHPFAHRLLRSFYKINYKAHSVKNGEGVEVLGEALEFIHVPRLHRPDTIITIRNDVRFTGDVFGSYYAYADPIYYERQEPDPDTREPTDVKDIFIEEAAEYFATVIGTYRTRGISLLNVLKERKPGIIAPAHGLVRTKDLEVPIETYRKLIMGEPFEDSVLLLYSTMYGFTLEVVRAVKEEIESRGMGIREFGFNDKSFPRIADILGSAYLCKKIVLVTSAYEAALHPRIRFVLELISNKAPAREMLTFMTFGRGAAFPRDLEDALKKAGFKMTIERFSIGNVDEEKIRKAVSDFVGKRFLLKPSTDSLSR